MTDEEMRILAALKSLRVTVNAIDEKLIKLKAEVTMSLVAMEDSAIALGNMFDKMEPDILLKCYGYPMSLLCYSF
jgi:hypothetical protein